MSLWKLWQKQTFLSKLRNKLVDSYFQFCYTYSIGQHKRHKMKTFTVAGVSTENNEVKFRVANDLKSRIAMLERCGNTDIRLVQLPTAMTKEQAAAHLLKEPFLTPEVKSLLQAAAAKITKPTKPTATGRVRTIKAKAKPVVEADDDGFVEPTDERIQVAMCRLARAYPGLSAQHLYEQVMLTHKEFGDYEPNF